MTLSNQPTGVILRDRHRVPDRPFSRKSFDSSIISVVDAATVSWWIMMGLLSLISVILLILKMTGEMKLITEYGVWSTPYNTAIHGHCWHYDSTGMGKGSLHRVNGLGIPGPRLNNSNGSR